MTDPLGFRGCTRPRCKTDDGGERLEFKCDAPVVPGGATGGGCEGRLETSALTKMTAAHNCTKEREPLLDMLGKSV